MATTAVAQREERMKRVLMGESLRAEIEMAIPRHLPVERFQRVLMTSVVHDDRLAGAEPMKIVKAALKVAPLGLLTDPLLGEAYLILDGKGEVQVRIGYRGLIKLARQSEQIAAIYAHEVYENDEIECVLGDQKRLHHKPNLFGDRGSVVGYYAVVKYTGGETDFEPMTVTQIDGIRAKSDGWRAFKAGKIKDTPWHSAYDEMAKKTALRRLLKRVPASPDLADALRHEAGLDQREYGQDMQDITPARPALAAEQRRARMLEAQLVEVVTLDGEARMVAPGEVEQFLRNEMAGGSLSEAPEFVEANRAHLERFGMLPEETGEVIEDAPQSPAEPRQAPTHEPGTAPPTSAAPSSPAGGQEAAPRNGNAKLRIWLGPLAEIEGPAKDALGELRAAIQSVESVGELNALTEHNGELLRALKGGNAERMTAAIDEARKRLDEPPDDSWQLGDEPAVDEEARA